MKKMLTALIAIFIISIPITNAQLVGIGTRFPLSKLHVFNGSVGNPSGFGPLIVESNNATYINLITPPINETGILFGNTLDPAHGGIVYNNVSNPNGLQFRTGGNITRMLLSQQGNLGIGNTNPAYILDVSGRIRLRGTGDPNYPAGVWFNKTDNSGVQSLLGVENDSYIGLWNPNTGFSFGVNASNGLVKIFGKLGIGTTTPGAPLSFPATLEKKISLYPGVTGDAGIAVSGNLLQIYSDNQNADIRFGHNLGTFLYEKFRFKANGGFAIAGATGTSDHILTSTGNGPPQYRSLASFIKKGGAIPAFNGNFVEYSCTNNDEVQMTNLAHTIVVTQPSRLLISASAQFTIECPGFDCLGTVKFYFKVNGVPAKAFQCSPAEELESLTISNYLYEVPVGTHTITFFFRKGLAGDNDCFANAIMATVLAFPQ